MWNTTWSIIFVEFPDGRCKKLQSPEWLKVFKNAKMMPCEQDAVGEGLPVEFIVNFTTQCSCIRSFGEVGFDGGVVCFE
jgi:hypothetical protein